MPGGNGNQKGMNRRNHHDSLGQSGQERRAQGGGGYTPPNNGGDYGLPQYGNGFRTTPTKRDFLGARADEIQRRQKKKRR